MLEISSLAGSYLKHFKIISGDSGKPKEKRIKRYARYRFFRCVRWSLLLRGIGSCKLFIVGLGLEHVKGISMKWKNPLKELPQVGDLIWIALRHWKEHEPMSWEIYGAEFIGKDAIPQYLMEARHAAINSDYIGQGSARWEFPKDIYEREVDSELVYAWLPADEFKIELK